VSMQPRLFFLRKLIVVLSAAVGTVLLVWGASTYFGYATRSGPIQPAQIQVLDGDTIRAHGKIYRLVGFDTPEAGTGARCESERVLADRATARLQQIVAAGDIELKQIPCSCPPGTEGTQQCNHGRLCGVLTSRGHDVGQILIGEGLAHPLICSETRCPPRRRWC
jgi:endonuclease YncB( thermonuclease family)